MSRKNDAGTNRGFVFRSMTCRLQAIIPIAAACVFMGCGERTPEGCSEPLANRVDLPTSDPANWTVVDPETSPLEIVVKEKKIQSHVEMLSTPSTVSGKTKVVNIDSGTIAIKNKSESVMPISFMGRVSATIRLRIVDKDEKTIASLDCSGYFAGHETKEVTLGKGKSIEDPITFQWPIAEEKIALIPSTDYKMIAEFRQGDEIYESDPVPFELLRAAPIRK
jgi:hypothetical protein